MKLSLCAELQDCSLFPPAHPPGANLLFGVTYLHLLAGDNLKVPSPARLAHTLPANATQPMEQESSHVLAAATAKAQQGGRAAMHPLGSREVGDQTYWASHRGEGGFCQS